MPVVYGWHAGGYYSPARPNKVGRRQQEREAVVTVRGLHGAPCPVICLWHFHHAYFERVRLSGDIDTFNAKPVGSLCNHAATRRETLAVLEGPALKGVLVRWAYSAIEQELRQYAVQKSGEGFRNRIGGCRPVTDMDSAWDLYMALGITRTDVSETLAGALYAICRLGSGFDLDATMRSMAVRLAYVPSEAQAAASARLHSELMAALIAGGYDPAEEK